ncbi:DSBA-like thioredoxin domain protein [compost metagenome]
MISRQILNTTIVLLGIFSSCAGQKNDKRMINETKHVNPLLCDPETGICEMPLAQSADAARYNIQPKEKPLKVIYFTDPICSSCWGIEPQLRKLKLEYGTYIEIEYRMGGLLPDWSYNSGGISKPSDVAGHWDEVSVYYDMPIDGDVWIEDPLASSYPPSIAFKAAQLQDKQKAILFLREIREMVFLHKKNIAKWEHIAAAAQKVGLNVTQLKADFENRAVTLFDEDLQLARQYGVRGFPTIFFVDSLGNKEMIYGSKPYTVYETSIQKLLPKVIKSDYHKNWETLFRVYQTLTAKEFAELSGTARDKSEQVLDDLVSSGHLEKATIKNGSIWSLKR